MYVGPSLGRIKRDGDINAYHFGLNKEEIK